MKSRNTLHIYIKSIHGRNNKNLNIMIAILHKTSLESSENTFFLLESDDFDVRVAGVVADHVLDDGNDLARNPLMKAGLGCSLLLVVSANHSCVI